MSKEEGVWLHCEELEGDLVRAMEWWIVWGEAVKGGAVEGDHGDLEIASYYLRLTSVLCLAIQQVSLASITTPLSHSQCLCMCVSVCHASSTAQHSKYC